MKIKIKNVNVPFRLWWAMQKAYIKSKLGLYKKQISNIVLCFKSSELTGEEKKEFKIKGLLKPRCNFTGTTIKEVIEGKDIPIIDITKKSSFTFLTKEMDKKLP